MAHLIMNFFNLNHNSANLRFHITLVDFILLKIVADASTMIGHFRGILSGFQVHLHRVNLIFHLQEFNWSARVKRPSYIICSRIYYFFYSYQICHFMEIKAGNYPVAVIGAGTMGRGIAQVAATAGHPVMLYDVSKKHTQAAIEFIEQRLHSSVKIGKITEQAKTQILNNISPVHDLEEMSQAKLVIEAIIENLAIKQDLFCRLESTLEAEAILATNTSSIDLKKICDTLKRPEHFAGMHFFNPAPLMALVEIIRADKTDPGIADLVFSLAEKWGKSPVHVRSSPGFIVNRAARPFYGEALVILREGGTDASTCDAIMRDCGGFRMGPFELMDLIGLDVNYEVTCQIWESFDRHPRFDPSVLQKELVDAGQLGRKSGKGFFDYKSDSEIPVPQNAEECSPPESITIEGAEKLPESLLKLLQGGTIDIKTTDGNGAIRLPQGGVVVLSNGKSSLDRAAEIGSSVISLDLCLDFGQSPRIVLAPDSKCPDNTLMQAVGLFQTCSKQLSVIKDIPGMVLTRIVAMLVNESSMLVQENVADAAGVNLAMRKGVNYPLGPLEWAELWGYNAVVETLKNLRQIYGDRYQVSDWLREKVKLS